MLFKSQGFLMINIGALFPPVIIDSDSALGITLKASRVSKNYLKLLIISIFFFFFSCIYFNDPTPTINLVQEIQWLNQETVYNERKRKRKNICFMYLPAVLSYTCSLQRTNIESAESEDYPSPKSSEVDTVDSFGSIFSILSSFVKIEFPTFFLI